MAGRRKRRVWSDDEKRMICAQTRMPRVSVSQVARRYDVNANLVFTWLRDPRYAGSGEDDADTCFLPVELVGEATSAQAPDEPVTRMEIDLAGGVRLRVVGAYDPDALARLIRGLSA
jgi:transposase